MSNVGDEQILNLRIRVTGVHEEMDVAYSGLGTYQIPVVTGREVTFILRDYSDQEITVPEAQFQRMLSESTDW